jgi:hypothetical protein
MIDLFTELLIYASKSSLDGMRFTVDNINEEGLITESVNDHGILQENEALRLVKVEDDIGWRIDWGKTLSKVFSMLPIQDIDKDCHENEEQIINKYFPKVLENELFLKNKNQAHDLEKKSEVEMLEFIATEGIGAHLLMKNEENEGYNIDLRFLSQFEVRRGLIPYGAKLILNEDYKLSSIITSCHITEDVVGCGETKMKKKIVEEDTEYFVGGDNWRFAYNIFMASLLMHETVFNHAIECHFKIAGHVLASCFRYKDTMPKILYDFIVPFLYRTQEVNDRAYDILVNEGGLVHRIFAFTKKGLNDYYQHVCDNFEYKTPPEMTCADTPLKQDLLQYWDLFDGFVSECFDKMEPELNKNVAWNNDFIKYLYKRSKGLTSLKLTLKENMKRVLTSLVFNSSVWHEYIGNVSRYLIDSNITSCKVFASKPNLVHDTEQNYVQAIFLAAITSVQNMPRINDDLWKTQSDQEMAELWKKFQMDLNSDEFISKLKTDYLHPDILECSVSL